MDSGNWKRSRFVAECLLLAVGIISLFTNEVSAASNNGCSLIVPLSPLLNDSSCKGGDWGGFLNNICCGEAFNAYIYALALRANQTENIFLDSSQQRDCLLTMKSYKDDVFGCGIEKLTSGAGACSDFSVAQVKNILGEELGSLDERCSLEKLEKDWERTCASCYVAWKSIGATDCVNSNTEEGKTEADLCRIAVLVSLLSSRIQNDKYVHSIQRCLGAKRTYAENETSEIKQNCKSKKGKWILTGAVIGVGVIFMIAIATIILLFRCRYFKSTPPRRKGKVYRGVMSNDQQVAIKHLISDGNMETFVREVTSLSHVKHPNLVALLGCCVEKDECFLVYELCPNGSLSEWLFGSDKVLSWTQRLQIAIDSARGLWFLHTYEGGCIVHRDIKPTNILLGPNFEAKLSDFGLSKVIEVGETYVSSEVRGTFGYVDPEYQSNRHVNSFGDVYSFGMVLLQILSGKKVINLKLRKPMSLNKMAKALTLGGSISEFADPKLEGEYSEEAFDFTVQLALSCTALNQQRPSMEQVFRKLEEALLISTMRKVSTTETSVENHSNQ
ncbi:hypothetical protein L6164_005163 [Bauhinia variegata]|uniref:Uncharacterized protein n=1 Tax=Bauhinia variegata TaxID=167791 RepID=A0ACB9PPT8_BAUVA|nr:hypothetical protein L6164_005163 [Bauhinia variegata]